MYQKGDYVIFTKQKYSTHPGPRAKAIDPAPHGDLYSYLVDKFWVVKEARPDHKIVIMTRRNKTHVLSEFDPNLRPPRWWERLLYLRRFPKLS